MMRNATTFKPAERQRRVMASGLIDKYRFLQSCSIKFKMLTNLGNCTKININTNST